MLTPIHLLGQRVKPRWRPMEGNFGRQFQSSTMSCQYISSSSLHDFNFQFLLGSATKTFTTMKKYTDEKLLDQFYIFECLKRLVFAVWPKNCSKLSKDGKLMVKKDVHLVVSASNFSGAYYQVLPQRSRTWLITNQFRICIQQ